MNKLSTVFSPTRTSTIQWEAMIHNPGHSENLHHYIPVSSFISAYLFFNRHVHLQIQTFIYSSWFPAK